MAAPQTIAEVPTPFTSRGEVDPAAARRLYTHVAASGVDALLVAGVTGEFPALSEKERLSLFEAAADAVGPERVIAHVGAPSSWQSVRLANGALARGVTRMAAIPPPAEARDYLRDIVLVGGELLVDGPIPPDLGVLGGMADLTDLAARVAAGFWMLSRTERDPAAVWRAGGQGVVSGVAAALPGPFLTLAEALTAGDTRAEHASQARVEAAVETLGGDVAALKYALDAQGLPGGPCRMPIPRPAPERLAAIKRLL